MSTNKRIRGRTLQKIRAEHFRRDPLCVRCQAKTPPVVRMWTQLDHIVAIDNGGADTNENRQGLCDECHHQKTAEDFGRECRARPAKPTIDVDGWPIEPHSRGRGG